jgi:nucleotide-binding universal stress UspA family protein
MARLPSPSRRDGRRKTIGSAVDRSHPQSEAASIAIEVMRDNARDFDRIVACLFDAESVSLYERLLSE